MLTGGPRRGAQKAEGGEPQACGELGGRVPGRAWAPVGAPGLRSGRRVGRWPSGLPTHRSPKSEGVAASRPPRSAACWASRSSQEETGDAAPPPPARLPGPRQQQPPRGTRPRWTPGKAGPREGQGPVAAGDPRVVVGAQGGRSSELPRPGLSPAQSEGLAGWGEAQQLLQVPLPAAVMSTPRPTPSPSLRGRWRAWAASAPLPQPGPRRGPKPASSPLPHRGPSSRSPMGTPRNPQPGEGGAGRGGDHGWI